MLTRELIHALLILRNREVKPFSVLPLEMIHEIVAVHDADPETAYIRLAFKFAASGTTEDMHFLVSMIEHKPDVLLQRGFVTNRGGVLVSGVTLYEFFLGEGDPTAAKQIAFGFEKIPDGEKERLSQYERYRPQIEALAKQISEKKPAFDLKPLFDLIKKSSAADITAALNKDMNHESALRDALIAFRNAVRPKRKKAGMMHYEHYTTLQQAFDLLYEEFQALSSNYTNYDKCYLIWRQLFGYLQRSLPAVDRFAFARAFDDQERSLTFKYDKANSFPDCRDAKGDLELSGVGFDEMIFGAALYRGWRASARVLGVWAWVLENTCRAKISDLQNSGRNSHSRNIRLGK